MKTILLLTVFPCFIVADVSCPDDKVTCPEGKRCCEHEGRYTCCDFDDFKIPDTKVKVHAGIDIMNAFSYPNTSKAVIQAGAQDNCTKQNCYGECCSSSSCCPYVVGDCCTETTCCPSLHNCCPDARCCPKGRECCLDICCEKAQRCCPGGCCGLFDECCGTGCCPHGHVCCGTWCCEGYQKCGASKYECHNAGYKNSASFLSVLMLIGLLLISRHP